MFSKNALFGILIVVAIFTVFLTTMFLYATNESGLIRQTIIEDKITHLDSISSLFELRVNFMKNIVEAASNRPEIIHAVIDSEKIRDDYKGVPEHEEREMREVAIDMLNQDLSFQYFFYVIPNGDMYFLEPYKDQLTLTWLNYAFRDWYKGALETETTFLSEVYVSAATGHNVMAISVPMYEPTSNNQKLNGIWVGTIDLFTIEKSLHSKTMDTNQFFLIIDHNNNLVVDSRNQEESTKLTEFEFDVRELPLSSSVQTITTKINEIDVFVVYETINVGNRIWTVLHVEPTSDAFAVYDEFLSKTILVTGIFVSLLLISLIIFLKFYNP